MDGMSYTEALKIAGGKPYCCTEFKYFFAFVYPDGSGLVTTVNKKTGKTERISGLYSIKEKPIKIINL